MYTGLLHTHKLVVLLFLLLYIVKTALLVLGKEKSLESFNKLTRLPEILISFLFLATGIGLLIGMPKEEINTLLIIKIALVFITIPLAVIGFRRKNKMLGALALLLILATYGLAEMGSKMVDKKEIDKTVQADPNAGEYDILKHGKALFTTNCITCHGADGKLNLSGAKDLTASQLTEPEIEKIIRKGKNAMAAYEGVFKDEEIKALTEYVSRFRVQE